MAGRSKSRVPVFRRIGAAAASLLLLLGSGCASAERVQPPPAAAVAVQPRFDRVVLQQWDITCGAASLATILTFQHGDPVTEREVIEGMLGYTTLRRVRQRLGFSLLDLKLYAEARGYTAVGYGGLTVPELAALGPAIVPIRAGASRHFIVFRGLYRGLLLLADPAVGSRVMPVAEFERAWVDRIAFTVGDPDGGAPPDGLAATPADFAALASVGPP